MVIRVAMNACSLPFVTRSPLTAPSTVPIARARSMAAPAGTPLEIMPAQSTVLKARTEPTDRSMASVRMTQVMPKAISPLIEDWRSRDKKLLPVRNSGLMILIPATSSTSAIKAP